MKRQHVRSVGRLRIFAAILFAILLAGACEKSPADEGDQVYTLIAINGQPLPGPFPDPMLPQNVFEATSGYLRLNSDGTLEQVLVKRCKPQLPPGAQCDVPANAAVSSEGTYSRAEQSIELEGVSFAANFESNHIRIEVGYPPSQGVLPRFILEYHR